MKKIVFLLFLFTVVIGVESFGQENEKLTKKEKREIKNQKQAKLDSVYAIEIKHAIDNKTWVLEVDRLSNKHGNSISVSSNFNFIALEGEKAFIQLEKIRRRGIVISTSVKEYEVEYNKKGIYSIHLFLTSPLGDFDIKIDFNSNGQMASAIVQGGPHMAAGVHRGERSSTRANYYGEIVPLDKSTAYEIPERVY